MASPLLSFSLVPVPPDESERENESRRERGRERLRRTKQRFFNPARGQKEGAKKIERKKYSGK